MKNISSLTIIVLIFMTANVFGQKKNDTACANASTEMETKECLIKAYSSSNSQLNKIYNKILNEFKRSNRVNCSNELVLSESKWVAFRDRYANVWAKLYAGGSELSIMVLECKLKTTNLRIEELNILLEEVNK